MRTGEWKQLPVWESRFGPGREWCVLALPFFTLPGVSLDHLKELMIQGVYRRILHLGIYEVL